jgi:anti-sigma B factor antagonist
MRPSLFEGAIRMNRGTAGRTRSRASRERPPGRFASSRGSDQTGNAGVEAHKVGASCYLETERQGNAIKLVLVGELDVSCEERFMADVDEAVAGKPKDLVVDLSSLTFIDSTGLALLLNVNGLTRENGFQLHIVRSTAEIVRAVFEATGVSKLLPMCDEPPRLEA